MTIYRPHSQRLRDAASLLPVIGLFLLMPPVIALFVAPVRVLGVPLIVAYLFGVWLVLIGCSAWISHRLAPLALNESAAHGEASADARPQAGNSATGGATSAQADGDASGPRRSA